ncbi:MAG: flagellar motor switch protein FliN [Thermodesulfobacteriota bacterium]
MSDRDDKPEGDHRPTVFTGGHDESKLDMILDIQLDLSVVLGGCKLNVSDLINIQPGSVVELDNLAGEPLRVYINKKLVALGTAVVVNEKFGIKLTEIINKKDAIEQFESD